MPRQHGCVLLLYNQLKIDARHRYTIRASVVSSSSIFVHPLEDTAGRPGGLVATRQWYVLALTLVFESHCGELVNLFAKKKRGVNC